MTANPGKFELCTFNSDEALSFWVGAPPPGDLVAFRFLRLTLASASLHNEVGGNGLFGNDGVDMTSCTDRGGRCFFGCKAGWEWAAFCHNILSCCIELKKHKPIQSKEI
ncbi:beta-defensin 136 [Choloepus didactylus]|uniref:beta-defensin 136 n=1 Tax=Choloepus didactylus TaxID=27675 RepID=UPI0018A0D4B0|nr:beta-defensin 136 [Choloepus didactylus]